MKNIKAMVTDSGRIVIKIDPSKDFGPSASGRTITVAASGGWLDMGEVTGDERFKGYGLMLNMVRKPGDAKPKAERKSSTKTEKVSTREDRPAKTSRSSKPTKVEKKTSAKADAPAGRRKRA